MRTKNHIAPQRETSYASSMDDRPASLPEGSEEVSFAAFAKYVGPIWRLPDSENGGLKRFAFLATEKHMNSAGSVHGGMLMTLADMAMSQTSRLSSGARSCATISLNCDFVGPGRLGDLIEAHFLAPVHAGFGGFAMTEGTFVDAHFQAPLIVDAHHRHDG